MSRYRTSIEPPLLYHEFSPQLFAKREPSIPKATRYMTNGQSRKVIRKGEGRTYSTTNIQVTVSVYMQVKSMTAGLKSCTQNPSPETKSSPVDCPEMATSVADATRRKNDV